MSKIRALIAKGWCQRHFALNADGDMVPRYTLPSSDACRFCLMGAIIQSGEDRQKMVFAVAGLLGVTGSYEQCSCAITTWNDKEGRTKEEVLELLEKI